MSARQVQPLSRGQMRRLTGRRSVRSRFQRWLLKSVFKAALTLVVIVAALAAIDPSKAAGHGQPTPAHASTTAPAKQDRHQVPAAVPVVKASATAVCR